jgi:hypothetical protein
MMVSCAGCSGRACHAQYVASTSITHLKKKIKKYPNALLYMGMIRMLFEMSAVHKSLLLLALIVLCLVSAYCRDSHKMMIGGCKGSSD